MSVLQTINLNSATIKVRFKEPYVTSALNEKMAAILPRGVFAGFTVVPTGGFGVSIQVDPVLGFSGANVLETSGGKYCVTIMQPINIAIDLTAQSNTTVYIALDAQFAIGTPSAAQIRVVDAAELSSNLDLVLLTRVSVPLVSPVLTSHINSAYRLSAGDSITTEAKPRINLIGNPGFEQDPDGIFPGGWQFFGSGLVVTASTDNSHSGTKSLKMVAASPTTGFVRTFVSPAIGGEDYRAGAWLRSTGGSPITGAGVDLFVVFLDRNDDVVGSPYFIDSTFTGGGTTYVERKTIITAPPNADIAVFTVLYEVNTAGTLYLDDIEFSTRRQDDFYQSRLYGGPTAVADVLHTHTSGASTYGGSGPWADGTVIPAGTTESALDAIPAAVGGSSGAAKVGFTPTGNISSIRVDTALAELDTKKAGLALNNVFTHPNTFTMAVGPSDAITATGQATGAGVIGTGGFTNGVGVIGQAGAGTGYGVFGKGDAGAASTPAKAHQGVLGVGGAGGIGVQGLGEGIGVGVFGTGGGTNATGVQGLGGAANGSGVVGNATGTGYGVYGRGAGGAVADPTKAAQGVVAIGGTGGRGLAAYGEGAGAGVFAAGGTTGYGVDAQGVPAGIRGTGGTASAGVVGGGGSTGPGGSFTGGPTGTGVVASGGGTGGLGGDFTGTGNSDGLNAVGNGTASGVVGTSGTTFTTFASAGVAGFGATTATLGNTGVLGVGGGGTVSFGGVGGFFTGGDGLGGNVNGGPGISSQGGISSGSASGGIGVNGVGGATDGIGVSGTATGIGYGVIGTAVGHGALPSKAAQGVMGLGGTAGVGVHGLGGTTGTGVFGRGGTTDGIGVNGVGGTTNGIGVRGDGTGTGTGGYFQGGPGLSAGVLAFGSITGPGGVFSGGSTSTGGDGVRGTAFLRGTGVKGVAGVNVDAGDTFGLGGWFIGASGAVGGSAIRAEMTVDVLPAIYATAVGFTGAGIHAFGGGVGGVFTGGTGGAGIFAQGGSGRQGGVFIGAGNVGVSASTTGGFLTAIESDGNIDLTGATPTAFTQPWKHILTQDNLCTAWAVIQLNGASAPTLAGSPKAAFNINAVTGVINTFSVTFPAGGEMVVPYAIQISQFGVGAGAFTVKSIRAQNESATGFDFVILSSDGTTIFPVNDTSLTFQIHITVNGRQ